MKKITKYIPGTALALVIAVVAKLLESLESRLGVNFIGGSVIALFIGMLVNAFFKPTSFTAPGIKATPHKCKNPHYTVGAK